MSSRASKSREIEIEESCASLRNLLGDDETVPLSITFSEGERIDIDTNAYKLQVSRNAGVIHQYSVEFEPEILSPRLMRSFLYQAICQPKENEPMGQNAKWQNIIYDDQKIMYSAYENLDNDYVVIPRRRSDDQEEKKIIVKVKKAREISSDDLESLIMIYNIAFQKAYRTMGLTNFRRKWLNLETSANAGNFKIYSGFVPSISALSGGLSYLLDIGSKIEREGYLYDEIREGINNPNRRSILEESIRSFQLQTRHLKKPKIVQVSNVIWDKKPRDCQFQKTNPKTKETITVSIAQYYHEAYNIEIPQDDVLIEEIHTGKNERRCLYPSSVLKIIGISDAERRDFRVMKSIAAVTRIDPSTRKQRLDKFISDLKNNQEASSFLNQWGFEINESRKLTGYRVRPAILCFGDKNSGSMTEFPLDSTLGFQRSWKNFHLYKQPQIKKNVLIVFPERYNGVNRFVDDLIKVSNGLGLTNISQIVKPFCVEGSNHPNAYKQRISRYISETQEAPSFIVCVLPDQKKERYSQIKMFLTVQLGIPSQCVKLDSLKKNPMSILTNVAVQIAAKSKGIPFKVSSKCLPVCHTMVVGLSLTTLRGNAPVCAGVATTDVELSQYYSKSYSLKTEKVIPDSFISQFMGNALDAFKENTGSYPKRVVVYREGVGYGLMPNLKNTEVQSLISIIQQVTGDDEVSLAYLVAQKHCSIRILLNENSQLKSVGAGTVVTGDIASNGVAEFYLVSHHANQGSANPTRYTIIHHSPRTWTDNQLILLTHYQTLHYYNWAGSIRVPAVLMYASRLAEFVRTYLGSNEPSENLQNHLHFL